MEFGPSPRIVDAAPDFRVGRVGVMGRERK
jgi:hypothetical protein